MSDTETEMSDEALVRQIQKGDEKVFSTLMDRYTGKLLVYGRRLIPYEENIGDTVQDIFVTVYQNINDFDATRKFSSWIYRIAHNAFVDVLRKKNREPIDFFDIDRVFSYNTHEESITEEKEKEEIRVLLEKGLSGLKPAYREIIDLYYFENFSYQDISDILHIPIGTVGIRLSRARKSLKKKIEQSHHE